MQSGTTAERRICNICRKYTDIEGYILLCPYKNRFLPRRKQSFFIDFQFFVSIHYFEIIQFPSGHLILSSGLLYLTCEIYVYIRIGYSGIWYVAEVVYGYKGIRLYPYIFGKYGIYVFRRLSLTALENRKYCYGPKIANFARIDFIFFLNPNIFSRRIRIFGPCNDRTKSSKGKKLRRYSRP